MRFGRLIIMFFFGAGLLLHQSQVYGQKDGKPLHHIGVRPTYGFIIPHRTIMRNIITGHVPALEIYYEKPTIGLRPWQRIHSYPTVGITLYSADLGNEEQLGSALGLFPYIRFPIGNQQRLVRFGFQVGTGLGYIEKRFDQEANHQNTTIGSHLNALIQLRSQLEFNFSERIRAGLGLSFTHFSNASARVPNLGINIPGIQASLAYGFRAGKFGTNKGGPPPWESRSRVFVIASSGFKETYPAGGVKYMAYAIQGMYMRDFSQKSSYNIGIDLMYNSSLVFRWEQDNPELDNNFAMTQIGLNGGWTYRVGDFDITLQSGIYLLSKFKTDGATYSRIGYRWHFKDKYWVGARLKTHGPKADYFEIAVGYRLK